MSVNINPAKVESFFEEQLKVWPLAAANFEALRKVEVKEFMVGDWPVKVQFNPARAVSSGAKVDAASIKQRKCFLCGCNRPEVQGGIPWGDGYEILVNPFPIFPRHLTIPNVNHCDQRIAGRISHMMALAWDLKDYTVFYNGPQCGASAPDHFHFQAGNSDFLTLPGAIEQCDLKTVKTLGESVLALADELPIKVFVIDTPTHDFASGTALFNALYEAMPLKEGQPEPMMNILAYTTPLGVRIVVIPRKKHRPACYGTEGDDCMMLSPASVDLGGVFITPRLVDYKRMDADIFKSVIEELTLNNQEVEEIAANVR